MFKLKRVFILFVFAIPFVVKAQTTPEILDFVKFVGSKYKIPESLKYDCGWNYAVVKLKTDKQNQVTDYECLNEASDTMKNSLRFLVGYQFPKKMRINGHPVIFYITLEASIYCKPKPTDRIYPPTQVVQMMALLLYKIRRDDPKTILIQELITASSKPGVR